ncbi:MAG: AMP-binding protein [Dehalococcoidia bacterium]|nr:AMP-binding protein [Dehalococcoidia bacterium]
MAIAPDFYDPATETMPASDRTAYTNYHLRRFVGHAYRNAPSMKNWLDKAGVKPEHIRTVKDLEKIPLIRRSDIMQAQQSQPPFGGFLAAPLSKVDRVAISPGPTYFPHQSTVWGKANASAYYAMGFRPGDVVVVTFSYLYMASLGGDSSIRTLGATVIATGTGNTEQQVQIIRQAGVTGFYGNPSFLVNIINKAEEQGYNFKKDFRLRVALIAAEMVPQSTRRFLEQDCGLYCSEAYGTSEGQLAFECPAHNLLHVGDTQLIEIVDPATGKQKGPGEVGEIVGTAFHAKAFPIVRFATGDLSYYTDEPCPCGRTSRRIARILGRAEDVTKVKGVFVYPKLVAEVISRFPEIVRFQVIVTRPEHRDLMTLKLELKDDAINKDKLSDSVNQAILEQCRIRADKLQFVPTGTIPEQAKTVVDERKWD